MAHTKQSSTRQRHRHTSSSPSPISSDDGERDQQNVSSASETTISSRVNQSTPSKSTATEMQQTTAMQRKPKDSKAATEGAGADSPPARTPSAAKAGVSIPSIMKDSGNPIGFICNMVQDFTSDSIRLIRRCSKPDAKGNF